MRLFSTLSDGDIIRGTVEVLYDGRWGFVCQPILQVEVSESICDGFGYERDGSAVITQR